MATKRVPQRIISKIEAANRHMRRAADLNFEVEEWMERNGIEYAFDFAIERGVSAAYEIPDVDAFVRDVESEMARCEE